MENYLVGEAGRKYRQIVGMDSPETIKHSELVEEKIEEMQSKDLNVDQFVQDATRRKESGAFDVVHEDATPGMGHEDTLLAVPIPEGTGQSAAMTSSFHSMYRKREDSEVKEEENGKKCSWHKNVSYRKNRLF